MKAPPMTTRWMAAAAAALLAPAAAHAQAPYPWNDRVQPAVTASVTLDPATRDLVYRYTVANGAGAEQRINIVRVVVATPASGVTPPAGWAVMYEPGLPEVFWFADGEIDPAWSPTSEGDVASYMEEIAPGASLGGFELRSPCAPAAAVFRASGYNHMRTMEEDTLPDQPASDTPDNVVQGATMGPSDCSVVRDWGNRRPATDGFMGVVNFAAGDVLPAGPVLVQLRFARDGQAVDLATFHAELNGADVTAAFQPNSLGDLVAQFAPGASAAQSGRNVLLISVDGVITGTTRTASDVDRIVFTVP